MPHSFNGLGRRATDSKMWVRFLHGVPDWRKDGKTIN